MQKLLTFFNSGENLLRVKNQRGAYETHYTKVESEFPNLTYLYYSSFQDGVMNPFRELKFAGFYMKNTNRFVCDSYLVDRFKRDQTLDLTGITLEDESDAQQEAVESIRKKIRALVPFDTESLSDGIQLESYEVIKAKNEAYTHYIYDTDVEKDYYATLYTANMQQEEYPIFVQFLLENEQAMEQEAEAFIQKRGEVIGERLKYTKTVIQELEELKRTNQYRERKKMFDCVDQSMKTVQIGYKKQGHTFFFKIENSFSTQNDYLSTYRIVQANEKREFESLFGRHAEIELDNIVEIRYGRKILYRREMKVA